jgi:glucosamine 6-phosphate synthetase-like amidotransferase/phosphosugar isomerase protein
VELRDAADGAVETLDASGPVAVPPCQFQQEGAHRFQRRAAGRPVADGRAHSPVIAIVPGGRGGQALQPVLERLRGRGADLVVVGGRAEVAAASAGFALPAEGVAEELQPILEIIPLQLLAHEIAIARGQDPDAPRALAKVTQTR